MTDMLTKARQMLDQSQPCLYAPHEYRRVIAGLLERQERMEGALRRSLNWLSSYPGGNAMGAYDEVRAALRETGE